VVDVVSQRENERSRIAVDGRLVADDQQCTFLVIHERAGDTWAIYPHGVDKLGVPGEGGGGAGGRDDPGRCLR